MKTKYKWDKRPVVIDLDKLARKKDTDLLLRFGGAEFIIQYRVENAGREGHPFVDIVTVPYIDRSIIVDLCDGEGLPVRTGKKRGEEVYQILLGQRVTE